MTFKTFLSNISCKRWQNAATPITNVLPKKSNRCLRTWQGRKYKRMHVWHYDANIYVHENEICAMFAKFKNAARYGKSKSHILYFDIIYDCLLNGGVENWRSRDTRFG